MTTTTFPATKLLSAQRMELAIQAMAGAANISHLAAENDVSRKFVYQQKYKAQDALEEAFAQVGDDDGVLSSLAVTKEWLRQAADVFVTLAVAHTSLDKAGHCANPYAKTKMS